jgi:hypothetical protein
MNKMQTTKEVLTDTSNNVSCINLKNAPVGVLPKAPESSPGRGLYVRPIPELTEQDAIKFWHRVIKTRDCWIWTGIKTKLGYGHFYISKNKGVFLAHRIAFYLFGNILNTDKVLDHICRNHSCVNPAHLRQITQGENVLDIRSQSIQAKNKRKTHCPQGHEYTPENTYMSKKGQRHCRACWPEKNRLYKERRRSA